MDFYALGKDIQSIRDRLAQIELKLDMALDEKSDKERIAGMTAKLGEVEAKTQAAVDAAQQ